MNVLGKLRVETTKVGQCKNERWKPFRNSKSWCVMRRTGAGGHEYMMRSDGQMRRFRSRSGALAAIRICLRRANEIDATS